MLSVAADCPFLPRDLVSRLYHALTEQNAQLAVAASDGQSHPVIGLWSVALREELCHALVVEGRQERSTAGTARYKLATRDMAHKNRSIRFFQRQLPSMTSRRPERLAALDGG